MRVLVTGCIHSFWQEAFNIYYKKFENGVIIDLIVFNGDTETYTSEDDFECSCIKQKYRILSIFKDIYNGKIKPPCPIILIGGNHENSEMFFKLPFGGYVSENVFYIGRASQVKFGDLKISGISGIYAKKYYYNKTNEKIPIRGEDIFSSYHYRSFSEFQLCLLKDTDLMFSHDWPNLFTRDFKHYRKKFLTNYTSGFYHGEKIVKQARPKYWFSAHHHVYYTSQYEDTKFAAYSKPYTPYRFAEVYEFEGTPGPIVYTGEWLSILKATQQYMKDPSLLKNVSWDIEAEKLTFETLPDMEVLPYNPNLYQTTAEFCNKIGIENPLE